MSLFSKKKEEAACSCGCKERFLIWSDTKNEFHPTGVDENELHNLVQFIFHK